MQQAQMKIVLAIHQLDRRGGKDTAVRKHDCLALGGASVYGTSATLAKGLLRWDVVMASSALRSALRLIVWMPRVDSGAGLRPSDGCGAGGIDPVGPAAETVGRTWT